MTIWRPRQHIRVIAIGLHWRGGRLLAAEVRNDKGDLKGVRPLGGGVEFGETWQDTLVREFEEELQIAVTVDGSPEVVENIYRHEGHMGHEVVFAAPVVFPDGAFADQDVITFHEDNGTACVARWFDLDDLDRNDVLVFPDGLRRRLS